jgi:hypothetical protein
MALVINDRVKETTTTTGTGTVTLGGAVSGFDTFAAGIGNSNTTYYCIQLGAEFEVGLGTLAGDSSTLARTTVISSSNSDSAVDFSAGAKNVFCTLPASKATVLDASGNLTLAGAVQLNSTFTVGANDQGYDVTLHGDTASRNVVWDSSADSLIFTDNAKALFGAGSDLQIWHDGSDSYLKDVGTGRLVIETDGTDVSLKSGSDNMLVATKDGSVELYYDNAKKLETTSSGVDVTGVLTASGIVTANAKLDLNGTELILDADADTSITADTDDQIDFRIGGADKMEMNATAFSGGAIYENADDISANYSITAGKNAFSVGPITIASGVTVTVPSGQRWVIL